MLDLSWKVFCMTGNVDTYLLFKEIEVDDNEPADEQPSPEDEFLQ